MSLDVYALGNAIVDIQIQIQDSLLAELGFEKGSWNLIDRNRQEDILQKLLGTDRWDTALKAGNLKTAAGGSAANTMHGISQLGGHAGFCGKVASDELGALYAAHMQKNGVTFNGKQEQGMTGTCIVLISKDAQRTMLTCLGVSKEIDYEDVNEELLKNSSYIYLEGYLFESESTIQTLVKAIEVAKKNDVKVALTASDVSCIDRHRDLYLQMIQNDVDLLISNAQEARSLSNTDSNEEALQVLSGWCRNVAITDGKHGSIVTFNGEVVKITPKDICPLDTTGAGDAYAAGLLYGITNDRTIAESGEIASLFSATVVTQIGPQCNDDIPAELKDLL